MPHMQVNHSVILVGPDDGEAVSYTHLDVYKRQAVGGCQAVAKARLPARWPERICQCRLCQFVDLRGEFAQVTPCLLYTSQRLTIMLRKWKE